MASASLSNQHQPSVMWPTLHFGPINLWSFPAAWRRDLTIKVAEPQAPAQKARMSSAHPFIRMVTAHR